MRTTILAGVLVVVPGISLAETDSRSDSRSAPDVGELNYFELIASPKAPTSAHTFVRQLLPPVNAPIAAVAQSRIVYLNRTGITVSPGNNDSRSNRSTIVGSTRSVPAWNTSAANWAATVACMKDMFSRWDVTITDVDPGNVPHIEAVFGGSPQSIGMQAGVGGVSPFTSDCGVIENSIVFTFTSVFPDNPQTICEVMAQEVAHSYGLDHEMLASDPMTYLNYNGKRSFKDQTVACGEFSNRPCGIGGSQCRPNQNSVQLLNARLGTADAVPPILGIISPSDGATVEPGFGVEAMASDNVGITEAKLLIDDVDAGTVPGAGPFTFATDAALAEGPHTITVEVTDGRNPMRQTITVTVAKAGGGGGSGSGSDTDGDGDIDEDDGFGDDSITGGCSSTRGGTASLALILLAFAGMRRRRAA